MANKDRNIVYLGKDFNSLKSSLEQYAKTYFSTTYNDFSEASPGNMFMEMSAYVGDVLSFYTDTQVQENFIQYASQTSNVYDLAYLLGYKPKSTSLSSTIVDFFQLIPSTMVNGEPMPNWDYALDIEPFTELSSSEGVNFIIEEGVNFSISSSTDPTNITVAQTDINGPTYFLLQKSRRAISGNINTKTINFGEYEEFPTVEIPDSSISYIMSAKDIDGNDWYEVDYLGQDLVYKPTFNPQYMSDADSDSPYILETFNTQRRFTSRFISPSLLQIQFGSGKPGDNDLKIVPNFENVGIGVNDIKQTKLTTAYSPTNFIFTDSYGIAPSNTSITFTYITGGGIKSNVDSNTIRRITDLSKVKFNDSRINPADTLSQHIINNFYINNPIPATGGKGSDTIEEIKQNSSANFAAQMRNVTKDDYLIRTLSLPSQYGAVSKAYAKKPVYGEEKTTLDIYVLSQDSEGKLKAPSQVLKTNLKTYLNQYRMIGDIISIKNAYIINIGVNFEIITLPNYNNNKILSECIQVLKNHFDTKKWQINEPIIIKDIEILLDKVEGVQTVKKIEINNISDESMGYSKYSYDIKGATRNRIIYPSLDPSIFEVKYPNLDIKGRVSIV